jgi:hypothetical protein
MQISQFEKEKKTIYAVLNYFTVKGFSFFVKRLIVVDGCRHLTPVYCKRPIIPTESDI